VVSDRPQITLRLARDEDASDIAEIWQLGWRDGHLGFVPQELVDVRREASFRTRAPECPSDTTVATVDEAVAGFVMVVDDEVEQVYVSAAHRGTGVAATLIGEAERQVKANCHANAWLAIVAGNARARAFYARPGGSTRGRSSKPPRPKTGLSLCRATATRSGCTRAQTVVAYRDCAERAPYDATSRATPTATSNHPAPSTPPIADHAITYISVVHGSKSRPRSGQIQLSNTRSTLSPKIHQARSAIRGPKPLRRMRKQHMTRQSEGF
jgi:GNAT superfamily N-acetyltransferase